MTDKQALDIANEQIKALREALEGVLARDERWLNTQAAMQAHGQPDCPHPLHAHGGNLRTTIGCDACREVADILRPSTSIPTIVAALAPPNPSAEKLTPEPRE